MPGDVRDATSMCLITDSTTSANMEVPGFQGTSTQSLPSAFAPSNSRRDEDPRLVLRIHIHLRRHRHAILAPGARNKSAKHKERRLRKRLKERKALFDESTLLAPTLRRQTRTPLQPRMIVVFNQAFSPAPSSPRSRESLPADAPRQNPPAYRTVRMQSGL